MSQDGLVPLDLAGRIGSANEKPAGQEGIHEQFSQDELVPLKLDPHFFPTTRIQWHPPPTPVHAETQKPTRTLNLYQLLGKNAPGGISVI